MHRQILDASASGGHGAIDKHLAFAVQLVNDFRGGVNSSHTRVTGENDILGVVFISLEAYRTGLHAQRHILGHEDSVLALMLEVERAGQNAVVPLRAAESRRQQRLILVVEFHAQRAALRVHRNWMSNAS